MCAPISGSRMSYIAAEIARSRRVAQGLPAVFAPTLARSVSPTTARMVEINTPIGVLTFFVRDWARVRDVAPTVRYAAYRDLVRAA